MGTRRRGMSAVPRPLSSPPPAGDLTMRILLVSDLHYALPQLDWVVRVGPDYDLVVVAG